MGTLLTPAVAKTANRLPGQLACFQRIPLQQQVSVITRRQLRFCSWMLKHKKMMSRSSSSSSITSSKCCLMLLPTSPAQAWHWLSMLVLLMVLLL
jgi:hypothetical protein